MKIKELRYLANLIIKSSEKSNNIMVLLLSISMIIIIPVFVLWTSVNVTINNNLNAIPYMLFSQVQMTDYRIETASDEYLSGFENISIFDDIDSKIVYENYHLTYDFDIGNDVTLSIDDKTFNIEANENRFFNIIDVDKSAYYFPKNFEAYGSIFVDNCDQSFTNNGKKQVIISEKLLENLNLSSNDVYGKKISIHMLKTYVDHTFDGYLCYEYKVVGVIKKEITELAQNSSNKFMEAQLFFCSTNVYDDNGEGVLKPIIIDDYNQIYTNIVDKESLNKEYIMLGIDGIGFTKGFYGMTEIFLEGSDYIDLAKTNGYLINKSITPSYSQLYQKYQVLYDASIILTSIFATAGIVLILITILYYYLNIKHNVNKHQNFLTILRAIGAHDSDIPKIYMMQSNILCGKASLIFAVFGFILCALIKIIIDTVLMINGLGGTLSISWLSILTSVVAMIAAMFVISNIIAIICVIKMSKRNIMEILQKQQ